MNKGQKLIAGGEARSSLRIIVYDEIILEVPEKMANDAAAILRKKITTVR